MNTKTISVGLLILGAGFVFSRWRVRRARAPMSIRSPS